MTRRAIGAVTVLAALTPASHTLTSPTSSPRRHSPKGPGFAIQIALRCRPVLSFRSVFGALIMHDTALAAGVAFFDVYLPRDKPVSILDLGSMDVNGTLRQVAPPLSKFIGVDIAEGPGVDIVMEAGAPIPVEKGSFDACVSTSCFEHDAMPWQTFLSALDCLKPGGLLYINAPSNGPYHAFPVDNWRFYPDAGMALADWGRSSGYDVCLVESGTLARQTDAWNDFIAIFQKAKKANDRKAWLFDRFPSATNIRKGESSPILNLRAKTEDMTLLTANIREVERLRAENKRLEHNLSATNRRLLDAQIIVDALYTSSSWRLTAPLRSLVSAVRGLKQTGLT